MASASLQQEQLIVTRPDDWHLHLRDGGVLCQHRPEDKVDREARPRTKNVRLFGPEWHHV
jgi:hypothetical protein